MSRGEHIDLNRLQAGDKEAFKALFETYYVPLREFAAEYIGSLEAADIAQESLIKFWDHREGFDHIAKVRSFLYNTTRNAVLNVLAHRKVVERHSRQVGRSYEDGIPSYRDRELLDTEYGIIRSETIRHLRREIDALPKRMREIMEMALEGKRNDTIAKELNINRETVRSVKKSAHKRLRLHLQDSIRLLLDYEDDMYA